MNSVSEKPASSWAVSLKDKITTNELLAVVRRGSNIRSYGVIKVIMGARVIDSLPLRVRCECSIPSCEEIIEIKLSKRREIRRNFPTGFIVAPMHSNSALEDILFQVNNFSVVNKPQFTEEVTDL